MAAAGAGTVSYIGGHRRQCRRQAALAAARGHAALVSFGRHATASSVDPDSPLTSKAASPFVRSPSESPAKDSVGGSEPGSTLALTCTVDRQPGTLFSGVRCAAKRYAR